MKISLRVALSFLCLSVASSSLAADFMTARRECGKLKGSTVEKVEQRFDIFARGFSVLPPQGDSWCYRMLGTAGVSFFRIPRFKNVIEGRPLQDEVVNSNFFAAIAISLKELVNETRIIQGANDLATLVNGWLSDHLFSQIMAGVRSTEHHFRLVESTIASNAYSGASCVKFHALVEEMGSPIEPDIVFLMQFVSNLVCRHPVAAETDFIWIGFVERYPRGAQPVSASLKQEYEPYVESVQFMPPR